MGWGNQGRLHSGGGLGTGPTEEEASAYMAATETSKQRQQGSPEKRLLVSAASRDKTNARQGVRRLLEELLRIRWEILGYLACEKSSQLGLGCQEIIFASKNSRECRNAFGHKKRSGRGDPHCTSVIVIMEPVIGHSAFHSFLIEPSQLPVASGGAPIFQKSHSTFPGLPIAEYSLD